MLNSSAEPPVSLVRTLSAWAVPWLMSTTAHTLLLLALVLTFPWSHPSWQGASSRAGLEVSINSPDDGDGAGGADAGGADPTSVANRFEDAEPAPTPEEIAPAHTGGGGSDATIPLLNEKPAVSLAGVLPAAGVAPGAGGGDGGGVGPAEGLTTQPQGSNRVRGGYARTGVFGAMGEGRKFVYVFDRSGSMDGHGGAPLSAAKAELIRSLKDLGQTHQFQIIFYNEHPRVFSPTGVAGRLVFGTDQNKYLAQKFVGSITADGATRHEEALEMALRMGPDVIFFLTDADEPRLTTQQLTHIERINSGTLINAIEFGYGRQVEADNFLVRLARQNGGQHVYVDVSRLPAARR